MADPKVLSISDLFGPGDEATTKVKASQAPTTSDPFKGPATISIDKMLSDMTPDQKRRYENLKDSSSPTISKQDPMSYVRSGMGFVRGIGSSVAGGATAAAIAGLAPATIPEGPMAGRLVGNLIADQIYQQMLQRAAPAVFGAPQDDLKKSWSDSAVNALTDTALMDLIPAGLKAAKSKLNPFKPNPLEAETRAAFAADPKLPLSVGQATGSKAGITLENLFGGQRQKLQQAAQQTHLTKSAEDMLSSFSHGSNTQLDTPMSQIADISSSSIRQEAARHKNVADALYTQLEKVAVPNEKATVAVPTTKGSNYWNLQHGFNQQFTNAEIQGPIRLATTVENAVNVENNIDAILKDPTNVFNSKDTAEINQIKELAHKFTEGLPYDKNGNPVLSYQVAKAVKQNLIDLENKSSDVVKQRLGGFVESLRNSIGNDMKTSVNGDISKGLPALWSPEGKAAFNAAQNKFKSNLSRFNPKFAQDLANGADPDIMQSKVLQQALSSPEQMRQYKNALEPTATEPTLLMIKDILNKSRGTTGIWDGEAGLQELKKHIDSGVAKEAFPNSNSLQAFKHLLLRMKGVSPNPSDIGKVAVSMQAVRGGAAIGTGALTFVLTGSAPAAMATGGAVLASIPLAKKVISDFMLNPVNARRIAGITTAPPNSIMAQQTIKQILKSGVKSGSLKGMIINLTDQNGDPKGKATIDSDGNVVPIKE